MYRYGVGVLAVAAVLLVVSRGSTQALIPVFAIGVFVGFTLSQVGMVRHWHEQHGPGWARRARSSTALGAVLTIAALAIELVSKFTEGAWLVVIIVPLLVLLFTRIHRAYDRIGVAARAGPDAARRRSGQPVAVVVPVAGPVPADRGGGLDRPVAGRRGRRGDRLLRRSRGRAGDAHFRDAVGRVAPGRAAGHPALAAPRARPAGREVPARPGAGRPRRRVVVLIPEVQPAWWRWILHNQRGFVLQPGHRGRHRQRGDLPAPVPAAASRARRGPRRCPPGGGT